MDWLKKSIKCYFRCRKEKKCKVNYIYFDGRMDIECTERGRKKCGV